MGRIYNCSWYGKGEGFPLVSNLDPLVLDALPIQF